MTRDEAHDWLEKHDPDAWDFAIEWYSTGWQAYTWIGTAGEDYPRKQGTFVECVEFAKAIVETRRAQRQGAEP